MNIRHLLWSMLTAAAGLALLQASVAAGQTQREEFRVAFPSRCNDTLDLERDTPSAAPPPGYRFNTRCSRLMPAVAQRSSPLPAFAPGHLVRCHLYNNPDLGRSRDAYVS